MRKLTVWCETPEFAELITGYLFRMNVGVIYTDNPKLVLADVTGTSPDILESVVKIITGATGENHLSLS